MDENQACVLGVHWVVERAAPSVTTSCGGGDAVVVNWLTEKRQLRAGPAGWTVDLWHLWHLECVGVGLGEGVVRRCKRWTGGGVRVPCVVSCVGGRGLCCQSVSVLGEAERRGTRIRSVRRSNNTGRDRRQEGGQGQSHRLGRSDTKQDQGRTFHRAVIP